MKFTLQKPLEFNGVMHQTGEEVDVPKEIYDWLMLQCIEERKETNAKVQEFEKKIKVRK